MTSFSTGHSVERLSRYAPIFSPQVRLIIIQLVLYMTALWVVIDVVYTAANPSDDPSLGIQTLTAAAEGSALKKVMVIGLFFVTVIFVPPKEMLRSVSIPYLIALAWFLASTTWAIAPAISIRRWSSLALELFTVTSCLQVLGPRRSLQVVYAFFVSLLALSFLSVFLAYAHVHRFEFAIHPSNESDPTLIGAWRGPMLHKNIAGAVMTHASILFFHFAYHRRRLKDFVFFLGAVVFVFGTKSKTSVALEFFAIAASLVYYKFATHKLFKQIFIAFVIAGITCGALFFFADRDEILRHFWTRASFSGRGAIWMSLFNYLGDNHWLLGAGYGSFWAIGYDSPIYRYAEGATVLNIGHSHNGYLEALVAGGVIGLAFALLALVIAPFWNFCRVDKRDVPLYALCFGHWLFVVLQNFTESQMFAPDRQSWLFLLVSITLVNQRSVARRDEAANSKKSSMLGSRKLVDDRVGLNAA